MAPKRKRGAAVAASADSVVVQADHDLPKENLQQAEASDSPTKRPRTSRVRSEKGGTQTAASPKPTAQASSGTVQMPVNGAAEGSGENGEAGSMRMEPPPPAGSVDPVGYKTNPPPKGRQVRVYADGVFDLFHLGHMRVLQQAKTAFPDTYLIVGVTGDAETHKRKGLTVMSAVERAESLRHCRWVDEVIEDCPWIITMDFLEKHKIDYVAHDDLPYGATEGDDIYKPIKERGMFLVTQRTEGVSTTGIITTILRDYEQYVSRQLKRGTRRQELNISWLKKNELDLKRNVAELRETIQRNWVTTGRELSKDFQQFWVPSRPASPTSSPPRRTSDRRIESREAPSLSRRRSSNSVTSLRPASKNSTMDFAAGYAMGLFGGLKEWMESARRRNGLSSKPQSVNGESTASGSRKSKSNLGVKRRSTDSFGSRPQEQQTGEMGS